MANKVVERSFNKEMSVFGKWRADTPATLNTAFNEDIKLWKGYRFIKSEDDVSLFVFIQKIMTNSFVNLTNRKPTQKMS